MALVHYVAKAKGNRILELPEEADALHLKPGQAVEIQIEPTEAAIADQTLALFAAWEIEDAARSSEQIAGDARTWQEFEKGINANRKAQRMRQL